MTAFIYVSHPQVRIDPAIPVPDWPLTDVGRARAHAFARWAKLGAYGRIVASLEVKAQETAQIFGAALGIPVEARRDMHENDRSATGFLPEPEFQSVADAFFAQPQESVRGWERACDAQARIVAAVGAALAEQPGTPAIFVGHGGVGTLLLCHLSAAPISRAYDQPPVGGGCWFESRRPDRWRAMEEIA
ncbi:histidine phosphatase family protein [Aquabacter spiritensis]|uniref:Broad specificity phosphatase PhoE n=1 Tax=Aquabacter spiritensis TaxID=933073 RepID=A0A4R3LX16_9HYPH|nr:histidine phosphatase family protein [Aquabacter spiritensis]TCT05113.1 broad specificity phosphatase PhoE [Aquabacter spiritensis]